MLVTLIPLNVVSLPAWICGFKENEMDSITSTPPLFSPQSATANMDSGRESLSSDFETFLKMLTVQVQNQDPLNPVDSTDYATQLATFSSVEQQVLTNDLLRDLGAQFGGSALRDSASWIGMEALVRAPVLFDGSPVTLRPEFAKSADKAALVVRDEAGAVVQRLAIDPSEDSLVWTGLDDSGNSLEKGNYRFEIESYEGTTLVDTQVSPAYSRVTEVRSDGFNLLVRLSNGAEIDADLVTGLRAP